MALSSMAAAISGLRTSQTALSVVGDNLANLNTPGFKSSRTTFSDTLTQTLRSALAPGGGLGGRNPIQIGTGSKVSSIDMDFTQGSITPTGRPLDLAIQGDGFFVLTDGFENSFTRVGAFSLDKNDDLVDSSTGLKVKGISSSAINIPVNSTVAGKATTTIDVAGNLDSRFTTGAVNHVTTSSSAYTVAGPANAVAASTLNLLLQNTTDYVTGDTIQVVGSESDGTTVNTSFTYGATGSGYDGTTFGELTSFISSKFGTATASISSGTILLTADSPGKSDLSLSIADGSGTGASTFFTNSTTTTGSGDVYVSSLPVFDAQGAAHTVILTYEKTADDTWDVTPTMKAGDGSVSDAISAINFNSNGSYASITGTSSVTITYPDSTTQAVTLNFGVPNSFNGLSQFGGTASAAAISQNGYEAGFFSSSTVNSDGKVVALFTNGITQNVGQLQLATFSNPTGLSKQGNNLYGLTVSSGDPILKTAGTGKVGEIVNSSLESSNVDIAQEFTNLITNQRAFQANARTITTTDEVLQELVNIVR
ncbi:MAG: flagellar hook-basal body complex protein [Planctomycetes bacterium]|nr:flagellar hook-basal body complex protein [Planctomycetota bacterium]